MRKVWDWIKKWWGLLVGGLIAILAAVFLGRKLWRDRLQSQDKEKLDNAEREMEYLRGLRNEVERDIGEQTEEVKDIDRRIEEQREVIRETMRTGAGMSDDEIAAEFARLGYILPLVLSLTFSAVVARAQDEPHMQDSWDGNPTFNFDAPCAPEVTESRRAVLEHDAQPGLWFHLEIARCMLGRLAVLPELSLQVQLLEQRREASDVLRDSLERRGDLAVQEAETAREGLQAARRALNRAEEDRDAWWRSPILWFVVGAVVAVALVAVGAYALGVITP